MTNKEIETCHNCKWRSEYKDPDDLWKFQCDGCEFADAFDEAEGE